MFGWDWPTLTLERLVEDWRSLGYDEEVYEKVFHRNAEAFFPNTAQSNNCDEQYRRSRLKTLRKLAAAEQVKPPELAQLASDVFEHCGVPQADADIAAEVALWAQLHGSDSHGVVHLPLYMRGLLDRTIKAQPNFAINRPMPACAVLDADHGLGLVASRRAMDLAIEIAKEIWAWRRRGAQQQPFRRGRLLCRSRRRAGPDRPCLHECHARDCADRRQRRIARDQSDRRRLSDARRRSDHRRHGDRGGGALAHPSCARRRAKEHSGRLGARSERPADDRSGRGGERLVAADRRSRRATRCR